MPLDAHPRPSTGQGQLEASFQGRASRQAPANQNRYLPGRSGRCNDFKGSGSDNCMPPQSPLFEPASPMERITPSTEVREASMQQSTHICDGSNDRNQNIGVKLIDSKPPVNFPSLAQDFPRPQTIAYDATQAMSTGESYQHCESSDDSDVPLRHRRVARNSRRHVPDKSTTHHDSPRSREDASTSPTQARKRPGPRPWAAKPVLKNDMDAKLEVIHEIERLWGKNFIKTYIPKCHRPLIKKRKNGKRTVYRDHETDPIKWLPSVLKAILMIARVTDDKQWLKKAMAEVVRYRIKNTGNRKPQLVTTDFDVIEDMLVRGWSVEESFVIRYKHLLMAQTKDERQTDDDIDHILGEARIGSDEESEEEGVRLESDDDEPNGEEEDEEDGPQSVAKRDETPENTPKRGWINSAPHCPPRKIVIGEQARRSKSSSKRPGPSKQQTQRTMYAEGDSGPYHGYGPPMYGYGHPHPAMSPHTKGFQPPVYGYGHYGPYGQYAPPRDPRTYSNGGSAMTPGPAEPPSFMPYPGYAGQPHHPSQGFPGYPAYLPYQPMIAATSAGVPEHQNYLDNQHHNSSDRDSIRGSHAPGRFSPGFSITGASQGPFQGKMPLPTYSGMYPENETLVEPPTPQMEKLDVKYDPRVVTQSISVEHPAVPSNAVNENRGGDDDMEDAVQLQLEEAEAEHKLIQLRKKLAQAKKRGDSTRK